MRRTVRLTERDLSRLVKRVINEGGAVNVDINKFPDGNYTLTKIEGDAPTGTFFVKKGSSMKIYTGNFSIQKGSFFGGGTIYTNGQG